MKLTDEELTRIRERASKPYMGGDLTTIDYITAEGDRSALLAHLDAIQEERQQ